MRIIFTILIVALSLSAWAAYEYLGDLAKDETGKLKAEFAAQVSLLEPQALAGNVLTQYKLARLYAKADPLLAGPGLAAQWMERAATEGHVKAQFYIAQMLEHGKGVGRDIKSAVLWYRRAARNGNDPDAQYALGHLYDTGVGVGHDSTQATEWYLRAAKANHPAAQYMTGRMFETGWGVQSDPVKAYMWYLLANQQRQKVLAVNPGSDPREALSRLGATLNKSQRDVAKKMAARWPKSY